MNNYTFATDSLLPLFLVTHEKTSEMISRFQGKNENGYLIHFDDEGCQMLWEEWQVCSAAMMTLFGHLIKEYEKPSSN